jgi:hypothetical protein
MTREPFIAHSELTNEIYIVAGKEKYRVTEQVIKAVMATKALEQEDILDKLRAEIEELEEGITSYDTWIFKNEVLDIIDKYKTESEKI